MQKLGSNKGDLEFEKKEKELVEKNAWVEKKVWKRTGIARAPRQQYGYIEKSGGNGDISWRRWRSIEL